MSLCLYDLHPQDVDRVSETQLQVLSACVFTCLLSFLSVFLLARLLCCSFICLLACMFICSLFRRSYEGCDLIWYRDVTLHRYVDQKEHEDMLARVHQQLFVTVRRDTQRVPRWAQFTIKVSYIKGDLSPLIWYE